MALKSKSRAIRKFVPDRRDAWTDDVQPVAGPQLNPVLANEDSLGRPRTALGRDVASHPNHPNPDSLGPLIVLRWTSSGTWVWSDPAEPPLEAFGKPPDFGPMLDPPAVN